MVDLLMNSIGNTMKHLMKNPMGFDHHGCHGIRQQLPTKKQFFSGAATWMLTSKSRRDENNIPS